MGVDIYESFLQLVKLGIGTSKDVKISNDIDWVQMKALADEQGLSAVILDGIEKLPEHMRPPKDILLNWIGEVLQSETKYAKQQKRAEELALLYHQNDIRTYVLKGRVVAECYIKANHRLSSDLDCFLMPEDGGFDAWSLGNTLVECNGIKVDYAHYKNSSFSLPGLTVENHQYLTPFRGNKTLTNLEKSLQSLLYKDKGENRFEGTWLYRPPVMVSSLFLIEHAFSHFLHEGLTWRHILDWMMYCRKHQGEIDEGKLDSWIDIFGFRKFYDSYLRLGKYLLGEIPKKSLTQTDRMMLADVWAPLDLHETVRGLKGKIVLAGNTWRARWKYRYFSPISMPHALWIQVKGFLFMKHPNLN